MKALMLFLLGAAAVTGQDTATVRIGAVAPRGTERCRAAWQPTMDYLHAAIPDKQFELACIPLEDVRAAALKQQCEFMVTPQAEFVEIESLYGASAIATLRGLGTRGRPRTTLGSVIFYRAGRTPITDLKQLRGFRVMGARPYSLGGWIAGAREIRAAGLDPEKDLNVTFSLLSSTVIRAVLNGQADAGVVNTEAIESMAARGELDVRKLRYVPAPVPGDGFWQTTRSYPEAPFAKLRHTPEDLAKRVTIALLRMPADSPAAAAAKCAGWTVALNYEPVRAAMRELRIGVYRDYGRVTVWDAIRQHWADALAAAALLLLLLFATGALLRMNSRQAQTERALRESEKRFRDVVNAAGEYIWEVDTEARFTFATERVCDITGHNPGDVLGQRMSDFMTPEQKPYFDAWWKGVAGAEKGFENIEVEIFHKSGRPIWQLVSGVPYRGEDGSLRGYRGAALDITERKLAEQRLLNANEELSRSNAELQHFAYVASHDLQEPLRMVKSYVQMLDRRYRGKLDADADTFIGYAVDGATRMKALIDDLLSYSRVGSRGRELVPVDSAKVVDQALDNLKMAIDESGAEIETASLPTVKADSMQLVQVFQNLIGNAIKFRGANAPRIQLRAEENGAGWHFSVHDNGIGVAPEHRDRIFEIFQRLHSRSEYPGTGIGLAVAKKIVERHGGRIWVESEPGQGATFHFTVPKAEEMAASQRA